MKYTEYFNEKTVWLTGASSGIGEQLAYLLSGHCARLIISARRTAELEKVKMSCSQPERVFIQPIDQSSEPSVREAVRNVLELFQKVDVLFANGGISQRALALETKLEVTRQIFEINFFSTVLLAQMVCSAMTKQGGGHIVVTSTLLGKWGFHTRSSYSAAKHALHGYFDSLRMEVEGQGVFVSIVTPGFISTEISRHALTADGQAQNTMDNNQLSGMSASQCAGKILQGVAARKTEFAVGGREVMGLWVKRFFPKWFEKMLRRKSAH